MARRKTRAELEIEIRYLRFGNGAQAIATTASSLIKYAGLTMIAYFVFKAIETGVGTNTNADISLKLSALLFYNPSPEGKFTPSLFTSVLSLLFGFSGILYGIFQANLRRSTIKRLVSRIQHLEREKDPNRTSSMLTPRGETRPEDV